MTGASAAVAAMIASGNPSTGPGVLALAASVSTAALVTLTLHAGRRPAARRPIVARLGDAEAAGPTARTRRDDPSLLARSPAWTTTLVAAVAGTAAITQLGLPATILLVVVTIGARPLRRRRSAKRRKRQIDAAIPDAIELLVLIIQAGLTPGQAVAAVRQVVPEPLRAGFDAIAHRLQRGQRLADALVALPELLGPTAAPLADAIASADRYGLPLAPILDRLADDARADRRRLADAHARTLSVRLSFPLVVCTLPAFVLLAIMPAVLGALSSLRGTTP